MERNHRRLPAPGVEEALSSMLWTPYPRTPSDTSDDDDLDNAPTVASMASKSFHHPQHSSFAHSTLRQPQRQQQPTRFARFTRPLSFMDKRKSCANTNRDPPHLYPEPIRYLSAAETPPHRRQQYIRQSASTADALSAAIPSASSTFGVSGLYQHLSHPLQQQQQTQSRSSSSGRQHAAHLPSYELVEQERLHHSLNSLSVATAAQNGAPGIYFIAPYGRHAPSVGDFVGRGCADVGTTLVNSFTDDFAQYQVS